MASERTQRRLAAIFAADMVGYSRLMEADEEGTIARQKKHRKELIDPKIAENHGRVVKLMGDGMLIEFASVVDAVRCAVEVQQAMAEREADVPEDLRIRYRVGINLGDIVIEGDDVMGDGVNVAARLEALAKPGEVLISGTAFDQLKKKLEYGYRFQGERKVKNIAEPVRVYGVLPDSDAGTVSGRQPLSPKTWRGVAGAAMVLLFVVAGLAWWRPWAPTVEPARLAKMAFPLPKKPSIAVLPFSNLSGNKKQDYLADGLSENIIQALSKVSEMFVIARNSTFIYKGKAMKVQRVAEELGVRYVLEGSIQKSGDRIRVTAQLIDAVKGHYMWSERYDRKLTELFAVQDEITKKIVVALQVKLTEGEQIRIRSKLSTNITAWEQSQRALHYYRRYNKNDNRRAQQLAKASVKLDPKNILGWMVLAWSHWANARFQWTDAREASLKSAVHAAKQALALDNKHPTALVLLGGVRLMRRDYDGAVSVGRKAVAHSPNFADGIANLGFFLTYAGGPREAIGLMKRAMRLAPYYPSWYALVLGRAYRLTHQYDKAIAAIKIAVQRTPNSFFYQIELAATLSEAGRMADARAVAAKALRLNPKFTVSKWASTISYKDPADQRRFLDSLRKAGLPK